MAKKKKNKYHEDDTINKWITKAKNLVIKSAAERGTLTQDEFAQLRHDIEATRSMIVTEVLPIISNEKAFRESIMDDEDGPSFREAYQEAVSINVEATGKRVTASVAESIARRDAKGSSTKFGKAKLAYSKAKSDEAMIFQLLKSMSGVANAMSALIK